MLHSEIFYEVPGSLGVQTWGKETSSLKIQSEKQVRRQGTSIRVFMDNLPGLPDEPFSFPPEDLSSRFLVIPTQIYFSGGSQALLESWKEVSLKAWDSDQGYKSFLSGDKNTKALAKALTTTAGKNRRDQVRALYEYVRDEVRTLDGAEVWNRPLKADQVLEAKEGLATEKSLLLYALLDAVGIKARVVWVANRNDGRAELEVPNPAFFEAAILQVDAGAGEFLYLDPSDRSLAFGHLPPYYESTRAVITDRKNPEAIVLPAAPFADNGQKAELSLTVDAAGQVHGQGELLLTGHHAWRWLRAKDTPEETSKAWLEKLAALFPGFDPAAVQVEEDLREQRIRVRFQLEQRAENVLGDEVSLQPARPFLATQPLSLPPEKRLTPVMLPFASLESTHLVLTWAEGFEIDALPKAAKLETCVGAYSLEVAADPAARRVEVRRSFSRSQHEIHGRDGYTLLRDLYEKASLSDAQTLVLLRP